MHRRSRSLQLMTLALATSAIACRVLSSVDASRITPSLAVTPQHLTPASALAPSPEPVGKVSGAICYPSEGTPAMIAFFLPTSGGDPLRQSIRPGQDSYESWLPVGEYYAYAWVGSPGFQSGGAYSQAVPCGLDISCTDHSLRPFSIGLENPATDIDLCDWYGGPGSVPTPPGGIAPAPQSASPGAEGISLNCDGSQQRVRVEPAGAAGRTVAVDAWLSDGWVNVWSLSGGDPMIRQIEVTAGAYCFGDCRSLILVPFRYSGSGADLRLEIYAWDGAGLRQVYSRSGTKGGWEQVGDTIRFTEAKFLYGEPNCCPCSVQTTEHMWDGSGFIETRVTVEATYSGTPPEYCQP